VIRVSVQEQPFDIGAETEVLSKDRHDIGAVVTFTGLVRDMAGGEAVHAMTLEHYPGMTEKELERIAAQAEARWPIISGRIIHRYGRLLAGDLIVLVVITSAHREAAFEAAWFIMDWLKTKAPFWKHEEGQHGGQWVEAKAEDDAATARWTTEEES